MNRRRFIWFLGGASGVLAWDSLALLSGKANESCADDRPVLRAASWSGWAMGSDVAITALHTDHAAAKTALLAAFRELELVEGLMSIYRPDSQVSRLNRDGVLNDPHPYLVQVLHAAGQMSRRSNGAFDVTVQPVWSLYAEAAKQGEVPSDEQVEAARSRVDWRFVEIDAKRIRLRQEGTTVTLNGIAQGFAADRVRRCLETHGIHHALIDTGEIGSVGTKVNGQPWTVGIQHPRHEDAYISMADLSGRCLATSGDYATSFTPDHRHNHLLDPHTGRSPVEVSSVTIAAPSATTADALSTAVSILGPEQGIELIKPLQNVDTLMVLKSGRILASNGFPRCA